MVLAGRPVEHSSDMDAMHEHYITVLGMAEGVSEATADGWRVRCERQLTRPAETVWDLLTGPRPPTPATHLLGISPPTALLPAPSPR
jgi:hypothetical protein